MDKDTGRASHELVQPSLQRKRSRLVSHLYSLDLSLAGSCLYTGTQQLSVLGLDIAMHVFDIEALHSTIKHMYTVIQVAVFNIFFNGQEVIL